MGTPHGTALITGGAWRVGEAIARDLAAHDFAVAVHHQSSTDKAEELVEEIAEAGGKAVAIQADLTHMGEASALIGEADKALGPVTLLINNASVFENDSVQDFREDLWNRHFDLHVKAPAILVRDFAAALPEEREGLVVNIIDQRVWSLTPRFFSYALSKSALWTATQTMAQALAPRIRVNAIGPGPALRGERQSLEDFERQTRAVLLGRGPELAEFGATIRYLWQARSVTGQMIALDGGQHLAWQTPDVTEIRE